MPPWILALVILLAVCVIGWYLIYSRHDGVPPEGFQNDNPLNTYFDNYLAPALYNLSMETGAKGLKTTIGADTVPYASLFIAWLSFTPQQKTIDNINNTVTRINEIITKEKLITVSPLVPYTVGMKIPDIQPVFNLTQNDKSKPLNNYVYQYIVQSLYKIIQEINSKKIVFTVGPDTGKTRALEVYGFGIMIQDPINKSDTVLPLEQKITQVNQFITRLNSTLSELKLTSVQTIIPYTVGMTLPTVESAPTTGASASRGTPTIPVVDADYQALAGQALTGQTATLTPELKTFLQQVTAKMPLEYPAPSAAQLGAAQGQDATGSVVVPAALLNDPAVYKAYQQIIKPHETPMSQQPGLVANQKGVDGVQAGAILTPSMRQQIRDDVRKAVGDELSNIQNEYEITYETQ